MSSSSIPTLADILYYTATDSYNYLTDNRPVQQLADNINSVAASLIGIGYGEHSSLSGALLAPGKGVELQTNGNIAYPTNTVKTGIYGIVIGSTNGGLNKVIWRSSLLDLEVLGLGAIIAGAVADQVLLITPSTGTITVVGASSVLSTSLVLGTVLTAPYVSIGKGSSASLSTDPSSKENALHNYGLTRKQNFSLFSAVDALPIQFSKTTYRSPLVNQGTRNVNPLNISLNSSTGEVIVDTTTADPSSYGTPNWILKEKYTQLLVNSSPDVSVTVVSGVASTNTVNNWSSVAYPSSFSDTNAENFEVSGVSPSNLQKFHISKYYQYPQGTPTVTTKPIVIVTVFDPYATTSGTLTGGETGVFVVCDFITYSIAGAETAKSRITLTGSAAQAFYNAFPSELVAL